MEPPETHLDVHVVHRAFAERHYPKLGDRITADDVDRAAVALEEEGRALYAAIDALHGLPASDFHAQKEAFDRHTGAFSALRTAYKAQEVIAGRRPAGLNVVADQNRPI